MKGTRSKPLVVLVVGASSGIGAAAATALASRGHRVFGSSREPRRVQLSEVAAVQLEVTDDSSVRACVAAVVERAGRIDAMVYSAGFYVAGAVEETSAELVLAQLDAYFVGAHRLVRAVLPTMREQASGRLIFMSSSAAVAAIPFHAAYSASKAALNHYADALSYEVESFGIRVTCIEGTAVRSGAGSAMRAGEEPIDEYEARRAAVVSTFREMQANGPPPTAIVHAIVRAVEGRRPPARYRVGILAKMLPWLERCLPRWLFRRQFSRFFGLNESR